MINQDKEEGRTAMRAVISSINAVEGFDSEPFAVEYADLESGETRKRLPVMVQMAWFRLKYPEGKITTKVTNGKDCFVATARVYPSYKDSDDCYLAEATASRGYLAEKPSVSPREWAQTAAVGIALRNAGFGLQFGMAGEEFPTVAPDELGVMEDGAGVPVGNAETGADVPAPQPMPMQPQPPESQPAQNVTTQPLQPGVAVSEASLDSAPQSPAQKEQTYEERIQQAMSMPCPIKKYAGKTLGDLIVTDPNALNWIVNKFHDDKGTNEAARLI